MRIGIDARSLHLEGVGRYIKELIKALSTIDNTNEYIIYISQRNYLKYFKSCINKTNFNFIYIPVNNFDLHKQPIFISRLFRDNIDLFHATDHWFVPLKLPCPLVTTFHDLMIKTRPLSLSLQARFYSKVASWIAIKKSSSIITVSEFNKKEIIKYYPSIQNKITVIPLGVSNEFFLIKDKSKIKNILKKYNILKNYFLFVGSLRNYKNLSTLFKAFALLPAYIKSNYDIIIAAKIDHKYKKIFSLVKKLSLDNYVHFINYVPTQDLVLLYNGATCFITLSLYESFCLPIIEAMACGTPVIASKIMAIPEVGGDAILLVNPFNISEIKEALIKIVENRNLRNTLVQKGLQRALNFSWIKTAQETIKVYEKAVL